MLARWNDYGFGDLGRSFSQLNDLQHEMDRMFDNLDRNWGFGRAWVPAQLLSTTRSSWPRVTLHDAGSALMLRAEVPGLTEKELDISLEQSSLTIRGKRETDVPEGYSVHRQERGTLAFARSFTLPCRVDAEKVTATLKNGVLEMTLPKAAEEQPRQIRVRAS